MNDLIVAADKLAVTRDKIVYAVWDIYKLIVHIRVDPDRVDTVELEHWDSLEFWESYTGKRVSWDRREQEDEQEEGDEEIAS